MLVFRVEGDVNVNTRARLSSWSNCGHHKLEVPRMTPSNSVTLSNIQTRRSRDFEGISAFRFLTYVPYLWIRQVVEGT